MHVPCHMHAALPTLCVMAPCMQPDGAFSTGSTLAQQPSQAASMGSMHGSLLPVRSSEASRAGSTVAVPVPPASAPLSTQLAFVQSQLDSLGPDDPVMSQFKLLGPSDRRQGGALPPPACRARAPRHPTVMPGLMPRRRTPQHRLPTTCPPRPHNEGHECHIPRQSNA